MADVTFKAKTRVESGVKIHCEARGLSFVLDEPKNLGGSDEGMNPVEALLSALGACKCIVGTMFAEAQGIKLKSIAVDLEGTLNPDGFSGKDPKAKIGFSKIHSIFHIEAENTAEELEEYIRFIEGNCPVQDTIVNSPEMTHELK